jgi:hypothetical protein
VDDPRVVVGLCTVILVSFEKFEFALLYVVLKINGWVKIAQ